MSEPIRRLEIRYPKLNFNSLLKFNFGYRVSTLFQSSHIRSLLIVKQSLLNFKLIRFSWYEHSIYICIYVYMYICICVHVYMCICVYVYMCICVYVYMYICIYVYMYIYMYIMWSNTRCLFYLHEIRNDRAISLFLSVDPPTVFSFCIFLCFLSYLLTSPLFCPISGGFKFSFGIEMLMNTK